MQSLPDPIAALQPPRRDLGRVRREAERPAHEPVERVVGPEPQEPLRDPVRVVAEQRDLAEHVELPAAGGLGDALDGREQEDAGREPQIRRQDGVPEDAVARLEGYVRADGVPDEKHAVVWLAPPRAGLDAQGAGRF